MTCMFSLAYLCTPLSVPCFQHLNIRRGWFVAVILTYLVCTFIHFAQPENQLFWIVVGLFGVAYLVHQALHNHRLVMQSVFVGLAVQFTVENLISWYPYATWRGIPVYLLYAALWCVVSWVFADNAGESVTILTSIYVVAMIRTCLSHGLGGLRIGDGFVWTNIGHVGQALCNQYWACLLMLTILQAGKLTWNGLKLRKFRVI
jgi:hypothetical protein